MPFLAHRKSLAATMEAVDRLIRPAARRSSSRVPTATPSTIRHIVESGIDVMGHLGLTPQSLHRLGGYRVQGRDERVAVKLADDALRLQDSGCFALVLELVPSELARSRSPTSLDIPTIGIGAGPHTSGQVLVLQDMLGLQPDFRPKFLRTWLDGFELMRDAVDRFDRDVKDGRVPERRGELPMRAVADLDEWRAAAGRPRRRRPSAWCRRWARCTRAISS